MPPQDLGGPDASEQSNSTGREEDAGHSAAMKRDFRTFFVGQTLSSFGTAFTRFAIPLLVYQLTGSSLSLAVTSALTFLPVVLFGLPIGVWADRVNRKHLMIGADIARAITIAWLPILSSLHMLALGWIYATAVLSSLLAICFETCQFAAVASLVRPDELSMQPTTGQLPGLVMPCWSTWTAWDQSWVGQHLPYSPCRPSSLSMRRRFWSRRAHWP